MGNVYEAIRVDGGFHKRVAIKILRRDLGRGRFSCAALTANGRSWRAWTILTSPEFSMAAKPRMAIRTS